MSRGGLTAALAVAVLLWLACVILMVAAVVAEDFDRALFLFMLMLANAGFAGILADARANS